MSSEAMLNDELLDSLYAASTDAGIWFEFLANLSRRMSADWCGLISKNSGNAPHIALNFGMPPEAVRLYKEHYNAIDPWYIAFQQRQITQWTGKGSELLSANQLEKSEFYNDFFKAEKYPAFYQCGTVLGGVQGNIDVLTILRDRKRQDYTDTEERLLHDLTSHLRRALKIHRKTAQLRDEAFAAAGVVDSLDVGLIGLDADCKICLTNNFAESLLRDGRILKINDKKLVAYLTNDSRGLSAFLESACKFEMNKGPIGALTVTNGDRVLHLTIVPIVRTSRVFVNPIKVLVIISDPLQKPKSRDEILIKLFRLTPAESRIAMLLLEGLDPRQISECTRTTENTVRFQIKAIFRKTGTVKQSQLIRLVSKLPGIASL